LTNIQTHTLLIDIATRNIISLPVTENVGAAARIMAEKKISSIIIIDAKGHPLGIVTERNILKAMQQECNPNTGIDQIMSAPVITASATMTCLDAYQVCQRDGIRHLVVVDDKEILLGVVSETDFRLRISLSELSGRRKVSSVMSRSVFTLNSNACLIDALSHMHDHRDSCVIVTNENRQPIGIVTERDIVRLYAIHATNQNTTIQIVMTTPVVSILIDRSINEAALSMLTAKIRHLVVVDNLGKLAGLISEHDLTHTMALNLIDDKMMADGTLLRTLIEAMSRHYLV
jgi:CBS domain-containing protein